MTSMNTYCRSNQNAGGFSMGYFTEIEMLQNKIKNLEEKIQEEREEHKEIYARMKVNVEDFLQEIDQLKKENRQLVAQNTELMLLLKK